jgi:hypothetical protein
MTSLCEQRGYDRVFCPRLGANLDYVGVAMTDQHQAEEATVVPVAGAAHGDRMAQTRRNRNATSIVPIPRSVPTAQATAASPSGVASS